MPDDSPSEQVRRQIEAYNQQDMAEQLARDVGDQLDGVPDEARLEVSLRIKQDCIRSGAPTTPEELWSAFKVLHGIEIPLTKCTEEMDVPMEWVWDFWKENNPNTLAIAPRGGAKTSIAAYTTNMKSTFRPMYESIHVASIRQQAKVARKYLKGMYQDRALRSQFERRPTATTAEWKNGSLWEIVTGSAEGISGQHCNQLTLDELEFWDDLDFEQTLGVPIPKNGYRKLWAGFSTRQKASGLMNRLTEKAETDGSMKLYRWSCFETMQRCTTCIAIDAHPTYGGPDTDKARQSVCALWEDCHGERATKSSGWMSRQFLIDQKSNMSANAWKTQYLCEKPSTHGLVLYNFEHAYSKIGDPNAGNYFDWVYQPDLPYYAAHDPSVTLKSVIYYFQVYAGRLFFFDQIVNPECPTIGQAKRDFYEHNQKMNYPMPKIIIVDPHRPDAVAAWEEGLPNGEGSNRKYRADKPEMADTEEGFNNIEPGVELVRSLLESGTHERRLFINPHRCPSIVTCAKEHSYKTRPSGQMDEDAKPDKKLKDEADTIRYAAIWVYQAGMLRKSQVNTLFW